MATKTTAAKTAPKKTVKASKKPLHETHGALPAQPKMNMMKAFGIRDGYDTDDKAVYAKKLDDMTNSDLHLHAHEVGIVPLDARDKLIASLLVQFEKTKLSYIPPRTRQVPQNPAMAGFMKKFLAGEA